MIINPENYYFIIKCYLNKNTFNKIIILKIYLSSFYALLIKKVTISIIKIKYPRILYDIFTNLYFYL